MKFTTKIVDYNGKAMIKLPQKLSKALGLKPGDEYATTLTPEKQIFIQFLRPYHNPGSNPTAPVIDGYNNCWNNRKQFYAFSCAHYFLG